MKKFFGLVLVGMMFLSGILYGQPKEKPKLSEQVGEKGKETRVELRTETNSWTLIEKAQKEKKIDLDTAILYKNYLFNAPDLLPEEYKVELSTIPGYYGRHGPYFEYSIMFLKDLKNVWNNLKSETKEKIKEHVWHKKLQEPFGPSPQPSISIHSPKDSDVVNSPVVNIEGIISTPKVCDLTSAWIEFVNHRVEIKLENPSYEKPQRDPNDRLVEMYKDTPGLIEAYSPPGRLVRHFSEEITLPEPGMYSIAVNAENLLTGRYERKNKTSESVWIVYPTKEKKDNEPPKVQIKGINDGEKINRNVPVEFEAYDDSNVVGYIYVNDIKAVRLTPTFRIKMNLFVEPNSSGVGTFLNIGENTIKMVVIDEYGNTTTKELKVFREK